MIIKTKKDIPASEITDPLIFKERRQIIYVSDNTHRYRYFVDIR